MAPRSSPSDTPRPTARELGPRGRPEDLAAPTRRCKTCGQTKPREDFYLRSAKSRAKHSSSAADRERHCKECAKKKSVENGRRYRARYPERRLARYRRWKYGLTAEAFEALWAGQGGRCAICRRPFDRTKPKDTHVDHDHAGGTVRGLLCFACNSGLGYFRDSPQALRAAAVYVEP